MVKSKISQVKIKKLKSTLCRIGTSLILILVLSATATAQLALRTKAPINSGWKFKKGDPAAVEDSELSYESLKEWILPTGNEFLEPGSHYTRPDGNPGGSLSYTKAQYDDSHWNKVNLPHDWAIDGPFIEEGGGGMGRLPSAGVGWYRKKITITDENIGKSVFLDLNGAMSHATVWVNGVLAGGWPYGYTSWRLDMTPHIKKGINQIAIRLDNPPHSSRWYPGGGIYRKVWLVKTSPVHVGHWGTFVKTQSVSKSRATIEVDVTVDNDSNERANATIISEIYLLDEDGKRLNKPAVQIKPHETDISSNSSQTIRTTAGIADPKLWGPKPGQVPHRYEAVTSVQRNGKLVDRYYTKFGIRTMKFDPNNGLFINGKPIEIRGVNIHHDLGPLGAAVNRRAIERQFAKLQQMGVNAIRTAHNPPSPEFLALADSMGILIQDEAFDEWRKEKVPNGYHKLFDQWHKQDLRAMVRRDRNHPSVFMWSIGNEVGEQWDGGDQAAAELAQSLTDIVHEEDSTRPTTAAMNNADARGPFPGSVDVIGLNYQGTGVRDRGAKYPVFHGSYPQSFIYGSETAAMPSTRGEYVFPVTEEKGVSINNGSGLDSLKKQVSSYGVNYLDFGSTPDMEFESQEKWPFVGGRFVWAGWDYLGEPTPFDVSRSSYYGIIDLAGFPKDRFYLYQSQWRPDLKMAHILPHWNWPNRIGKITPVHVYSSAKEAELFLNGESMGRQTKDKYQYRFAWNDVRYEPGTLRVITYKNGKKWAADSVKTTGEARRLTLAADRDTIKSRRSNLVFLTLNIEDEEGLTVPMANNEVQFSVSGPGEIVATANGDPTNLTSFHSPKRKAFNGKVLIIIRPKAGKHGNVKVKAEASGLRSARANVVITE